MSWLVNGLVVDGNVEALEHVWNTNVQNSPGYTNMAMEEQFEFGCTVVAEAFEAGVVEGEYGVTLSGHTNPEAEGDRKSLNISFSPVSVEYAEQIRNQADNQNGEGE